MFEKYPNYKSRAAALLSVFERMAEGEELPRSDVMSRAGIPDDKATGIALMHAVSQAHERAIFVLRCGDTIKRLHRPDAGRVLTRRRVKQAQSRNSSIIRMADLTLPHAKAEDREYVIQQAAKAHLAAAPFKSRATRSKLTETSAPRLLKFKDKP